jgi:rhomboid protease GluP
MCPNCRAFITTDDKVCPYCDVVVGPKAVEARNPRDLLGGLIPHAHFTTVVIVLINICIYLGTVIFSSKYNLGGTFWDLDGRTLFAFGAKSRQAILSGQWWRFITAGFLHGGLVHIFMNSWSMLVLGSQVEMTYGTSRYLVFYIFSSVTGYVASFYWSDSLSVVASSGVFGLIGAMIALGVRAGRGSGSILQSQYVMWAVINLMLGFYYGGYIDNAAHVGGIAGGFGIAYIVGEPRLGRPEVERLWKVAAGLTVALVAYCFLHVYLWVRTILQ